MEEICPGVQITLGPEKGVTPKEAELAAGLLSLEKDWALEKKSWSEQWQQREREWRVEREKEMERWNARERDMQEWIAKQKELSKEKKKARQREQQARDAARLRNEKALLSTGLSEKWRRYGACVERTCVERVWTWRLELPSEYGPVRTRRWSI